MFKIVYNYAEDYIEGVYIYLSDEYVTFVFGTLLSTPQTKDFICSLHQGTCANYTGDVDMSHEQCMQELDSMPLFTGTSADGYDYACRALHSSFAATNPKNHCPHLSFAPHKDPQGRIKCQVSKNLTGEDLFDDVDMASYETFIDHLNTYGTVGQDVDPAEGYLVLSLPRETDNKVVLGIVVPILLFVAVFGTLYWMQRKQPEDTKDLDPLKVEQKRTLRIVFLVWGACVLVFFILGELVVRAVLAANPDWQDPFPQDEIVHPYRGEYARTSETSWQDGLGNDDFESYLGIVVWITCLLAGAGMESLVWYYFMQTWSPELETKWRFAQFVFPLMLLTSLGLALHQNFLALPILVLGLWKFGFPETFMYLYIGVLGTGLQKTARVADLLNGAGTAIHHAAAALVISMMTIGAIPPSRYAVDACLILVMQHWVVLLNYSNKACYTAIELVL
ncbi:MAG: hypothetical protein SGILL_005669, partial [Bacillariaceae sp.]